MRYCDKSRLQLQLSLRNNKKSYSKSSRRAWEKMKNTLQRKDRGSVVLKAFLKVFKSDLGIIICYV